MTSLVSNSSEVLPWDEFYSQFRDEWKQGEHVTMVGPTGTGKTTLALNLLPLRDFVVIFGMKRKDTTLDQALDAGYMRIRDAAYLNPQLSQYTVLWPKLADIDSVIDTQRRTFTDAINRIFKQGGWSVFWDEASYLSEMLRMERPMKMLWQQGRSLGVSVVAATQRPAFVPLAAYDMATHLFFWRDNDEVNLRRIGGLGGLSARQVRSEVAGLEKHQFLYLNTRTGNMIRSTAEV